MTNITTYEHSDLSQQTTVLHADGLMRCYGGSINCGDSCTDSACMALHPQPCYCVKTKIIDTRVSNNRLLFKEEFQDSPMTKELTGFTFIGNIQEAPPSEDISFNLKNMPDVFIWMLMILLGIGLSYLPMIFRKLRRRRNRGAANATMLAALAVLRQVNACDVTSTVTSQALLCYEKSGEILCSGHVQMNVKPFAGRTEICFASKSETAQMLGSVTVSEPKAVIKKVFLYDIGDIHLYTEQQRWCAESGNCDRRWALERSNKNIIREDYSERCGFWICGCATAPPSCVYSHVHVRVDAKCSVSEIEISDVERQVSVQISGQPVAGFYTKVIGAIKGQKFCEIVCSDHVYYGECNRVGEHNIGKIGSVHKIGDVVRHNLRANLKFVGYNNLEAQYDISGLSSASMVTALDSTLFKAESGAVTVKSDDSSYNIDFKFEGQKLNLVSDSFEMDIKFSEQQPSKDCKTLGLQFTALSCYNGLSMSVNGNNAVYFCNEKGLYSEIPFNTTNAPLNIQFLNPITTAVLLLPPIEWAECRYDIPQTTVQIVTSHIRDSFGAVMTLVNMNFLIGFVFIAAVSLGVYSLYCGVKMALFPLMTIWRLSMNTYNLISRLRKKKKQ